MGIIKGIIKGVKFVSKYGKIIGIVLRTLDFLKDELEKEFGKVDDDDK